MTTDDRLKSRVLRRELHSSKAGPAITVAILAILALAWLGTECVLAALGRPALLLAPTAMATDLRGLPSLPAPTLIGAGVVLGVIGILLIIAALTSGRRGRHVIDAGRTAAVVNDEVIASALARSAATQAGISPDRAVASVGRRSASVRITPISGLPIDRDAVQQAVRERADSLSLTPALRTRVTIAKNGKVGG